MEMEQQLGLQYLENQVRAEKGKFLKKDLKRDPHLLIDNLDAWKIRDRTALYHQRQRSEVKNEARWQALSGWVILGKREHSFSVASISNAFKGHRGALVSKGVNYMFENRYEAWLS
ncbi:hypothetical protein B0H14DRAFT_2605042 [Mycena olivaceomarginata]|nr:hypothetical protein B0H14DRAFT_2605042 [Mycena olivaceomarginata]